MANAKPKRDYKNGLWLLIVAIALIALAIVMIVLKFQGSTSNQITTFDYSSEIAWAYMGEGEDKDADLFILGNMVELDSKVYLDVDDPDVRDTYKGSLQMATGIFSDDLKIYAPYYRQAALSSYFLEDDDNDKLKGFFAAKTDTQDSFNYYMEHLNNGRPFVLVGIGDGGRAILELMENNFADGKYDDRFVCAYIIGWAVTDEDLKDYPHLKMAQGETDTGVIIAFNTETEGVKSSYIIPEGKHANAINPLNWKTDSTPADKSLNKGACFMDFGGTIRKEEKGFCGAVIDPERGSLVLTKEVDPVSFTLYGLVGGDSKIYETVKENFPLGVLFPYDYQFFYRNLQENVGKRVKAFK
ncbi:MAG: DUF3089 domain-containing protein [Lachnospiraceae bacterium]|nr:DUF3089 domain-containing protein [Lachnospiraceae bacterium]